MQNYNIKTKRLGLRLLKPDDIDILESLESDPDVKRYFPAGPLTRELAKARINKFITFYEENNLPCFLIFDLETHEFIGRAGFGLLESGEVEIGYLLHKKFWGKGYASEAVSAMLAWAKENIDVDDIYAYATVDNIGSFRVMEKCGMQYFKTDIGQGVECRFYRIENR